MSALRTHVLLCDGMFSMWDGPGRVQSDSAALTLSLGDDDSSGYASAAARRAVAPSAPVDDEVDERINTVYVALKTALMNEKVRAGGRCRVPPRRDANALVSLRCVRAHSAVRAGAAAVRV